MRKILVIILIIGTYLYLAYAYFYNFLGQKRLLPPVPETKTMFITDQNNQTYVYVALGDSLTAGTGTDNYKYSYPYLLAEKLSKDKNVELNNLAQPGATSSDLINTQLPKLSLIKPGLITLLIGINDIHNFVPEKKFSDNFFTIADALKNTKAKVYILSVPYLGSDKILYFPYNLIFNNKTKEFNELIRQVVIRYGFEYIDLNSIKKGADFYSEDQFHPSNYGYKAWAEVIDVN